MKAAYKRYQEVFKSSKKKHGGKTSNFTAEDLMSKFPGLVEGK